MAKIKIVTHNGRFHADDVCAVATLDLMHQGNIEVFRTRDQSVMDSGDIVLDVGGKNDGTRVFDHHQPEGGGVRPSGIPYAAFGLIWNAFGKKLCANEAIWAKFDRAFVQPIDATDNGVQYVEPKYADVRPFSFDALIYAFNPTWKEDPETRDSKFLEAVSMMKGIIARELEFLHHEDEAKSLVLKNYNDTVDKRIVVLDANYPFQDVLSDLPEPVFAIYKSPQLESWHVGGVWKKGEVQQIRQQLPEAWAGKMEKELQDISGIPEALFCHRKRFMGTAKTKEGAIKMAQKALG